MQAKTLMWAKEVVVGQRGPNRALLRGRFEQGLGELRLGNIGQSIPIITRHDAPYESWAP